MRRRALLRAAAVTALAACAPGAGPRSVEEIVAGLSLERKVGQLMSVAFHGTRITTALEAMIRERAIGGVIFYKENFDDSAGLARLIGDLSRIAREAKTLPLFFEIDQEGGPVVRVGKGATVLPGQMALAATPDPVRSVRLAVGITAEELRAIGVNWNFAPDADVNDEPTNPVIGNRSFSSDPTRVSTLVTTAVQAYAAGGLLCCAKHFPGHGSATVDSHSGLPRIDADRATLERIELPPFRAAIAANVPAIMSAHIVLPAFDATPDLPATLSKPILTDLLRGTLGFGGIVVSDDLEMGALQSIGEAAAGLRAVQAGADFVLFRFDENAQREGHRLITDAVRSGALARTRLDASVSRIVEAKRRFGILDGAGAAPVPDLAANGRTALDLARASITLLRNRGVLPLRGRVLAIAPANPDISLIDGQPTLGAVLVRSRADVVIQAIALRPSASEIESAVGAARAADVVVVGTTDLFAYPEQVQLVSAVLRERPTAIVSLRGPYDVLSVPDAGALLCAYDGREPSLIATAEILTGERKPVGSLPVDVPTAFKIGSGMRDFA